MARSRRKAFTLVELLMAALIMIVGIVGLFATYNAAQTTILHSAEVNQAGELARAEIERAKVYGPKNFPNGTYSSGTSTATWTGTYDPTANSGSGGFTSGVSYYDYQGNRLSTSTGAAFSVYLTVTDTSVQPASSGTGYQIDVTSRRAIVATVTRLNDNTVMFTSGTNMVLGGI
jgi:type II secretory pathway pseudopilin PulG